MRLTGAVAFVVVAGLAVAGWFHRDAAPLAGAAHALGVSTGSAPPSPLQAAGVHKCVGAGRTSYLDGPCPKGSREVAANGGTLTVMPFSKPKPPAPSSGAFASPQVEPMDADERDRLRDKAIEDAANRR
jgi:hypothetical protein